MGVWALNGRSHPYLFEGGTDVISGGLGGVMPVLAGERRIRYSIGPAVTKRSPPGRPSSSLRSTP